MPSHTMNFTQRVVELNTTGVAHLTNHDNDRALVCFSSALRIMSSVCNSSEGNQQLSDRTTRPNNTTTSRIVPLNLNRSVPVTMRVSPPSSTDFHCIKTTYSHAFLLSSETEETYETASLYSAILIFNYALSLHQRGDEVSQHRAAMLYEHCLEILGTINDCFDCDAIATEALENVADIRYKQGDLVGLRCVVDMLFQLNLKKIVFNQNGEEEGAACQRIAPAA